MVPVSVSHLRVLRAAQLAEHADVAGEQGGHEHRPNYHGDDQEEVHFSLAGHSDGGFCCAARCLCVYVFLSSCRPWAPPLYL